jgi:hypothetical protein
MPDLLSGESWDRLLSGDRKAIRKRGQAPYVLCKHR